MQHSIPIKRRRGASEISKLVDRFPGLFFLES
jgi:hypothetical protein